MNVVHVLRYLNRTCGAVLKTLIPTSLACPPHVGPQKLLLKLRFNDQHYGYSLKFWHPISNTLFTCSPCSDLSRIIPLFLRSWILPSKQGLSTVRIGVKVAQVLFAQIYGLLANNNDVIKTFEFFAWWVGRKHQVCHFFY